MDRGERVAVAALAFILLTTVAWWALALWPVADGSAVWLERVREVCFNATETGLPDTSGWLLLVGQPLTMAAVLFIVWPEAAGGGIRSLSRSGGGRAALFLAGLVVLAGISGATVRVTSAADAAGVELLAERRPPAALPRLDLEPPETPLQDASGRTVTPADFAGRPAFVTFAFGHCETICPILVRNALEARSELRRPGGTVPRVVVITLDPWRDTPGRLPHLAEGWGLEPPDLLLGGEVNEVEAALDAWNVPRSRNPRTGDVVHPALTYVLDARGKIVFRSRGDVESLVALAGRL